MIFIAFLLSAALAGMLQSILYKAWWQKGLSVDISFCQDAAVEGGRAALVESVTNAKAMPIPILHVKFQMGRELVFLQAENSCITDQNYRSDIFSCMPWQQICRRLEFCCKKRGYYSIQGASLITYDLLWRHRHTAVSPSKTAMYVYPALVDPARLKLLLCHLADTLAAHRALLPDPFELQSIRDYAHGDPYRDINWKATARTGRLLVNVHAPASSRPVALLLDGAGNRLWEDLDLKEEAVRLCATLAHWLTGQGMPVAICTNGKDCLAQASLKLEPGTGAGHLRTAMELLARVDLSDNKRKPMETIIEEILDSRQTSDLPTMGGPFLYVLISLSQKESLARAFDALCRRNADALWILPLRPEETCRLPLSVSFTSENLYLWEAPYV